MKPQTNLDLLSELCNNANLGKYRHFHAAQTNSRRNSLIGIPVVIINIAMGSAFFVTLTQDLASYAKWIGAFLGLAAAVGSSLQTFLDFSRMIEGHRRIANRYLSLGRDCQYLQSQFNDGLITLPALSQRLGALLEEYSEVNVDAEAFPTGKREFKAALKLERERRNWLEREYGTRETKAVAVEERKPGSGAAERPWLGVGTGESTLVQEGEGERVAHNPGAAQDG